MPIPFRTSRRIEFADTDMAGIVHFSNFFRWMESAEVELLRSLGLSVKMSWDGQSLGFPRVAASCDYLAPATFEEVLDVAVTVKRVGTKSVTYAFVFSRGPVLVARGEVSSVCCRMKPDQTMESVEIPASIRAKLEQQR
jgi:YbgC/YbaW family acyl-CoA thioester hydrolase